MSDSTKMEDSPLWQMANEVVEHVYTKLADMPEEERWDMTAKLRTAASQLLYNVAVAVGNTAPVATEFDWAQTNKQLFALKTMYRFAGRQRFFKIDPEAMLKIDKMIDIVASKTAEAYRQTDEANKKEFTAMGTRIKEQKS